MSGCLLAACAEDESHGDGSDGSDGSDESDESDESAESDDSDDGVEPGTYHLTPENRDLQFELREDGTFAIYALEWDLLLFSQGVWSNEDGETVLRSEEPSADATRDPRCPEGCLDWSTTEGFTTVTEVRLAPTDDLEVIRAQFYDRIEEQDGLQVFTLGEPLAGP